MPTNKRLEQPVFLMCSERSGSNLITKLFDAHPDFAAPGTSHLFRVFAEFGCRFEDQGVALRDAILEMFDAKVSSWLLDQLALEARQALLDPADGALGMVATLMNAERERAEKARLFVKENSIANYLTSLESVSCDPSYLFMVRDPRDMALSWEASPLLRGGVVRATNRWLDDQEGFLKALRWLSPERRVACLTYEALVSDPEGSLRKVCERLEVPYSASMLQFHAHSRSARADADRAAVWANLSKPIIGDNRAKFVDRMSDDKLAFVEARCGSLMEAFGYRRHRGVDQPPHGSHADLEALTRALTAAEPWDKPGYGDLPREERARFERWSQLYAQLQKRPFSPLTLGQSPARPRAAST